MKEKIAQLKKISWRRKLLDWRGYQKGRTEVNSENENRALDLQIPAEKVENSFGMRGRSWVIEMSEAINPCETPWTWLEFKHSEYKFKRQKTFQLFQHHKIKELYGYFIESYRKNIIISFYQKLSFCSQDIQIFVLLAPSFFPCWPLLNLLQMLTEDKLQGLWHYHMSKLELKITNF